MVGVVVVVMVVRLLVLLLLLLLLLLVLLMRALVLDDVDSHWKKRRNPQAARKKAVLFPHPVPSSLPKLLPSRARTSCCDVRAASWVLSSGRGLDYFGRE